MRSKLTVLGGIFAMALTLGLGLMVGMDGGAPDLGPSHHVLAETKGPAVPTP